MAYIFLYILSSLILNSGLSCYIIISFPVRYWIKRVKVDSAWENCFLCVVQAGNHHDFAYSGECHVDEDTLREEVNAFMTGIH